MAETSKYEKLFALLKEDTTAPWWNDLSMGEKQATLEKRIDPERPESPFYKEPWAADEVRPILWEKFGAAKEKSQPFLASSAGQALSYVMTPPKKLEQPLKNIRETLASPKYPGKAGDYILDKTGSPVLAATAKTVLDLPTELPMMTAEGLVTPAGLATSFIPGAPGAVRAARRVLNPPKPKPAAVRPPAPGYTRLDPSPELGADVLPPLEVGQGYTPPQAFLDKLATDGKELVRGPSGGLTVVPRGLLKPVPEGKPFSMPQKKEGRILDGSDYTIPEITVTTAEGVTTPIRLTPDVTRRLQLVSSQFAAEQNKLISTSRTNADKIGADARFIETPSGIIPAEQGIHWTAPTAADAAKLAKGAGQPYFGTAFRKQFKARIEDGAPMADNIADNTAGLNGIVVPGAPAVPSDLYPRAFWRAWKDGVTVIEGLGAEGRAAAVRINKMYDTHEKLAMTLFTELTDGFEKIFTKRSAWDLQKLNIWTDTSAVKMYNMTQAQSDNLVDTLYTAGKIPPMDKQVEAAADLIFSITKKLNEHPGIRGQTVRNPFTGETKPVGQATKFYYNRPVSEEAFGNIRFERSEAAYRQWKKAYDIRHVPIGEAAATRTQYDAMLDKVKEARMADPALNQAYSAGVNAARTFHADEFGAPHVVLKGGGYGTDPISDTWNYLAKTTLLAERTVAKPELDLLETALRAKQLSVSYRDVHGMPSNRMHGTLSLNPKENAVIVNPGFIGKVFDQVGGRGKAATMEQAAQKWYSTIREFNSATLLQLAGVSSLPQTNYTAMRAGWLNTAKGLVSYLKSPWSADKAFAENSGALYSHYVQEMTHPQSIFGRLVQAEFTLNGFNVVDNGGRKLAAFVGRVYAQEQAAIVAKGPTNAATRTLGSTVLKEDPYRTAIAKLRELHLDVDKIAANGGKLTVEDEFLAAQVMANMTMGRTSIQGLPTWLAGADENVKLLMQFKTFLFTNSTEMSRAIKNAPDAYTGVARALRLAAGAEVSGEIVNDMLFMFREGNAGGGHIASPFDKPERTAKEWKKYINSPLGSRAIENFVTGIGTVWAGIFLSGLPDEMDFYKLAAGPTGQTAVSLAADTFAMAKGEYKHPLESNLAEDVARRFQVPGAFSIVGNTPQQIKEQRRRRAANERAFKLEF